MCGGVQVPVRVCLNMCMRLSGCVCEHTSVKCTVCVCVSDSVCVFVSGVCVFLMECVHVSDCVCVCF